MPTDSEEPSNDQLDGDDNATPQTDGGVTRSHRRAAMSRRRKSTLVASGFLLVVIAFGAWLGVSAFGAKSHLEQARISAQQAKDALLKGDTAAASHSASAARGQAQAARDATHSAPWNIAASLPWIGSPFKASQQITDVVLDLAADVLEPSAAAATAIAPDRLVTDGRVDVQRLRTEGPTLENISANATRIDADAQAITDPTFFSVLRDARGQLQSQTSDVAKLLQNTALAARIVPSLMGADGPRTYFMGFQTNAEARGTGGLLGGFGILRFDDGVPAVDTLAPNTQLDKPFVPLDLGPEYAESYGFNDPTTDYRNSNFSAHFPYAAQIWKSMWLQQTGVNVDGAIAIDPVALSYVLAAVGPVALADGEVITQDNVVELTESTAYVRFPTDQPARKQYLQDIAQAVVKKMTGPVPSSRNLFDALGKAISQGRIAVWSSSPAEQEALEQTPLAHVVPTDDAPYSQVVINNLGGNKLDYYLQRGIEYAADGCSGDKRNSTVTVRLASTVPPNLPEYVAGSGGVVTTAPIAIPSGTMLTSVRLVATNGATLRSATANGQRLPVFRGTERGHPTFEIQVAIPAGKSGELTFNLTEPTASGTPRIALQPLVDEPTMKVSVPTCSR